MDDHPRNPWNDATQARSLSRAELDDLVRSDGEILSTAIDVIVRAVPVEDWPHDATASIAGAIGPVDDDIEAAKAARLRRHLFADLPLPPELDAAPTDGRLRRGAERVRADLADLVPPGACLYVYEARPGLLP